MTKKFRYKGLTLPGMIIGPGQISSLVVKKFRFSDGTEILPKPGNTEFNPGDVIDVPDNPRILREFRSRNDFEESLGP